MDQTHDTKSQMLDTATRLFAERGFYGVSLAQIAAELSLTKQALIHHFGTKEKLYGQVLEQIADRVTRLTAPPEGDRDARLMGFVQRFCSFAIDHPQDTRLLMRELLDNKQRADEAARWYLEPFLRDLIAMVQATRRWQGAPDPQALAVMYQLLGAVNYFVISEPTLSRIFGPAQFAETQDIFPNELRRLVRAMLDA